MNQQQILNATITIEGIEMKNNRYSLLGHDKKRYSFFTTKSDGTDTQAFAQFKNMNLKTGDSVFIGYVIDTYQDKQGMTRESNKVISFRESNEKPAQTSSLEKTSSDGANRGQSGRSNDEFSKRLAIHGFVNAQLSNGATIETVIKDLPALMRLEETIDKYLAGGWQKAEAIFKQDEELPIIQRDDEPPIESFEEGPGFVAEDWKLDR